MVSANDEVKHLMDFEPETEADFIANMSNRWTYHIEQL